MTSNQIIGTFIIGVGLLLTVTLWMSGGPNAGGVYSQSVQSFGQGLNAGKSNQLSVDASGNLTVAAAVVVDEFTQGGGVLDITDANGGTYTLTEAELLGASYLKLTASGAGQAAVALTMPATSTMTTLIPNAGDCRSWIYDASAVVAGTTTTMTAGTGHDIIAYTTNDDVIDGAEFAQLTMCRQADGDVTTFTTEMLHAD